jgi:hypothetical protein
MGLRDTETPKIQKAVKSAFWFPPPLVPVLESQNLLDVESVFSSTAVLCDPVDQHCHFGNRRIHAIEEV